MWYIFQAVGLLFLLYSLIGIAITAVSCAFFMILYKDVRQVSFLIEVIQDTFFGIVKYSFIYAWATIGLFFLLTLIT